MRKALAVSVLLVLALFVAADFVLRQVAEDRLGAELQSSIGLKTRPAVSLGGFPFTFRLIAGSFPSVSVDSKGPARAGSVEVSDVDVSLKEVSFSLGGLLGGNGSIHADRGSGTATLSEDELNSAFGDRSITADLRAGRVVLHAEGVQGSIQARVAIAAGRLVVRPVPEGLPAISIELPRVVPGITYTGVDVGDGKATLSFTIEDATLKA